MADMRLVSEINSISRIRGNRALSGTPDGAAYTADWVSRLAMEGRVYNVSVGSATTPATFKTGYTALQPELVIDIPSGTTIIPISIRVMLEDSAGTDTEIVALTSTTVVGAGTSTAVTPKSTRTDSPNGASGVSAYSLYSGNGTTTPTIHNEFWRAGYAFADTTVGPLKLYEYDVRNAVQQIIVGAGALVIYVGATTTAPAGYIKVTYIELPSATAITG